MTLNEEKGDVKNNWKSRRRSKGREVLGSPGKSQESQPTTETARMSSIYTTRSSKGSRIWLRHTFQRRFGSCLQKTVGSPSQAWLRGRFPLCRSAPRKACDPQQKTQGSSMQNSEVGSSSLAFPISSWNFWSSVQDSLFTRESRLRENET